MNIATTQMVETLGRELHRFGYNIPPEPLRAALDAALANMSGTVAISVIGTPGETTDVRHRYASAPIPDAWSQPVSGRVKA